MNVQKMNMRMSSGIAGVMKKNGLRHALPDPSNKLQQHNSASDRGILREPDKFCRSSLVENFDTNAVIGGGRTRQRWSRRFSEKRLRNTVTSTVALIGRSRRNNNAQTVCFYL